MWAAKLRGRDGRVSLLGVHQRYSAARNQAEGFNRRYQIDGAFVEPFDAADPTLRGGMDA